METVFTNYLNISFEPREKNWRTSYKHLKWTGFIIENNNPNAILDKGGGIMSDGEIHSQKSSAGGLTTWRIGYV